MFPNVLISLRQQAPTGGTKGTTVSHIAFAVTNVRQTKDKARAAGYRIVTREEACPNDVVTDDISFNKEQGGYSAFVHGSGRDQGAVVRDEDERDAHRPSPHSLCGSGTRMKAWYVEVFGAAGHAWNL